MRTIEDIEKFLDSNPNRVLKSERYEKDIKFLLDIVNKLKYDMENMLMSHPTIELHKEVCTKMFNEIYDFAFSGPDLRESPWEAPKVTKCNEEIAKFVIKKIIEYRIMPFPCGG